jgi:hypothetical protein
MTEFIDTNTNTNNTMPTYFSKAFTTFNEELSLPTNCLPFTDAKFGLLNLQALECGPATIEHELVLVVDNSGSMGDKCPGDNDKTQMDQAIHTLKNIVGFLEENPNIKAYVSIFKFDDKFIKVVDRTNVTEENYNSIEKSISKIRPNGGTDIGNALKETTKYISELKTLYPTHQISHIFMTDGAVTTGETKPNILKQLVVKDIYNYFIGYGSQHDAKLLGVLSDFEKSSYHYIDALEKTGFVFGEILHSITHKVLYDCEIVVEHGVIYNYTTNLYTNKLYIGDIVGESNKVYHLFTDHPSSCYVHLKARTHASTESFEIHIFQETSHDLNFVNYAFRHRTLTLLGEVKQCQDKYDKSSRFIYDVNYLNPEIIIMYKSKMQELFDEMRNIYMSTNDKFIKMLCDDIHISQKTFGTKYGNMCISSRQTSQGTQRIYTVNTTPLDRVKVTVNVNTRSSKYDSDSDSDEGDICRGPPSACSNNDSDSGEDIPQKMSMSASASRHKPNVRSCAPSSCERSPCSSSYKPEPEPDDYEVSNDCMEDSPYLTQTAKTVMRSISYVSSSDSEEEKSDSKEEKSDSEEEKSDKKEDNEDDEMPALLPIDSDDEESNKNDLTISP